MKPKLLLLFITLIALSSCGVIRFASEERSHAGPAIRPQEYVPQNLVEEHYYPCSVPGPTQRRMIVYLPKDYYNNTESYPVFYLLHGARGYETAWIRFGEVYQSTDSLWREGLAEKCIVVMPNVNQYDDDEDYDNARFKDAYESILELDGKVESAFRRDVVAYVDSVYRTIPDRAHRAVAGLSVGGYQSIFLAANFPGTFGYVGAMSPYMLGISKPGRYRWRFYSCLHPKMARQYRDYPPYGYYLYASQWDMMRPSTLKLHYWMNKKGFPHSYSKYPGSHDWPEGWTQEYKDMLQKVFKNENPLCNQ
ncbi:MAG: esterase family protein [Bacteroidales bacterium]|nr:esterase family protein [Bacteroidales bacterium]